MPAKRKSDIDNKDKAVAASWAVAAHPVSREQFNLATRRHEWQRHNGEKVSLRGFKDKDIDKLRPGFNRLESKLADKVQLNSHINKQRPFNPNTDPYGRHHFAHRVGGEYIARTGHVEDRIKDELGKKGADPEAAKKMAKAITGVGKMTRRVSDKHATIRINPNTLKGKVSSGRGTASMDPSGTLAHEVGHAVDYSTDVKSSKEAYKTVMIPHRHSATGQLPLRAKDRANAYGDKDHSEHFAESFRSRVGAPFFGGKNAPTQQQINHSHTNSSKTIDDYFHTQGILNKHGHPDAARIVKVRSSVYGHAGRFGIAAAGAASAGYELHKHSGDIEKAWQTRRQKYGKTGRKNA